MYATVGIEPRDIDALIAKLAELKAEFESSEERVPTRPGRG
jgi:hypothetical protein